MYGLANRGMLKFKETFTVELKEKLKSIAQTMEYAQKIEVTNSVRLKWCAWKIIRSKMWSICLSDPDFCINLWNFNYTSRHRLRFRSLHWWTCCLLCTLLRSDRPFFFAEDPVLAWTPVDNGRNPLNGRLRNDPFLAWTPVENPPSQGPLNVRFRSSNHSRRGWIGVGSHTTGSLLFAKRRFVRLQWIAASYGPLQNKLP